MSNLLALIPNLTNRKAIITKIDELKGLWFSFALFQAFCQPDWTADFELLYQHWEIHEIIHKVHEEYTKEYYIYWNRIIELESELKITNDSILLDIQSSNLVLTF